MSISAFHQEQLLRLHDVDQDTAQDFCIVALQFLQNGIQMKLVEKAAKKLDWSVEKLESTLEALMELLRNFAKLGMLTEDLTNKLSSFGLKPEYVELLVGFSVQSLADVKAILTSQSIEEVRLKNLEWRLEVEIASRCLHNQCNPTLFLKLELQQGHCSSSKVLQMDIPMLLHLTEEVELALAEGKSAHTRKIMRHIK